MVGLGDSLATGTLCDCPSYPGAYSLLAAAALGQHVNLRNLAVPGIATDHLLDRISQPPMPGAVRDADIITVTIGINDLRRCLPTPDARCFNNAVAAAEPNIDAILDEVAGLQGDHPHVLRVTAYFNQRIGDPAFENFGEPFQERWAKALDELNAAICAATTAHGGVCVELLTVFNGPAGDQDAAALLSADHDHPNGEGNQRIADAIAATGYAPLQP
jgi:lysophospholipase L1-like esterase